MGEGDQIREHQAGVIRPGHFINSVGRMAAMSRHDSDMYPQARGGISCARAGALSRSSRVSEWRDCDGGRRDGAS